MSTIAVTPSEKKALRILMALYRRNGVVINTERFEELARNGNLVQEEIDKFLYERAESDDLMAEVNAAVVEIKEEIDHPTPDPV